jgi:hypothetical protein
MIKGSRKNASMTLDICYRFGSWLSAHSSPEALKESQSHSTYQKADTVLLPDRKLLCILVECI